MRNAILLPTDGSALSRQAVTSGIQFVKESGAGMVGLHVLLRYAKVPVLVHKPEPGAGRTGP
jgi:hypothetical protein